MNVHKSYEEALHPTLDLKTKRATMNCTNMPTMTVRQTIIFLFLDVAHITKITTASPNRLTARLARVLSWFSGLAKPPIRITAITRTAPAGTWSFSGINAANLTPVLFQIKCIGLTTMPIGT